MSDLPSVRGQPLSGTAVSAEIRANLKERVEKLQALVPGYAPGLTIVQVGDREDSNVYIRGKLKAAEEVGIVAQLVKLPNTTSEGTLLALLRKLNNDPKVHGIIVQMPLDSQLPIDSHLITDSVSPAKDVDGLNTINEGQNLCLSKPIFKPIPNYAISKINV